MTSSKTCATRCEKHDHKHVRILYYSWNLDPGNIMDQPGNIMDHDPILNKQTGLVLLIRRDILDLANDFEVRMDFVFLNSSPLAAMNT